jgi:predicted transposase YdaD
MQRRYRNRKVFEHHLIRFVKVLERSTTMDEQQKKEVKEVLRVQYSYDYFIDENPDVIERVARGKQEAKQEGKLEGRLEGRLEGQIEASRQTVLEAVEERFPALLELVRERVVFLQQPEALRQLAKQVWKASDEESARQLFLALGH